MLDNVFLLASELEAARSQMAFTLGFHIILAAIGVAFPAIMLIANLAEDQPVKFAAMECVQETSRNVTEYLGGICTEDGVKGGIGIPGLASFLVGFSTDTEIIGLVESLPLRFVGRCSGAGSVRAAAPANRGGARGEHSRRSRPRGPRRHRRRPRLHSGHVAPSSLTSSISNTSRQSPVRSRQANLMMPTGRKPTFS